MQLAARVSAHSLLLVLLLAIISDGIAAEPGTRAGNRSGDGVWKAGAAQVVITPQESMWMAGYGARDKPSEGKLLDLYAKALVLEDPAGKRLVLVTTDLVGMSATLTDVVAAELRKKHELARDEIMFTSSHTHCGPVLADNDSVYYPLTPEQEQKVQRYTERLRGQLVEVVGAALTESAPARLSWGNGKAGFAVNRREPTPKGIINGTNPDGPVDHDVPVLRVESREGKLRAVAFGYACHNTTLGFYQWCGDYAGFAQEYLEAAHPGTIALFFMGCGADANPLPRRTVELCQGYGRQLADAVETVLKGEMQAINGSARAAYVQVELPLDKPRSRDELASPEAEPSISLGNRPVPNAAPANAPSRPGCPQGRLPESGRHARGLRGRHYSPLHARSILEKPRP